MERQHRYIMYFLSINLKSHINNNESRIVYLVTIFLSDMLCIHASWGCDRTSRIFDVWKKCDAKTAANTESVLYECAKVCRMTMAVRVTIETTGCKMMMSLFKVGLYRIRLVRILSRRHRCRYVEPGGCHGS